MVRFDYAIVPTTINAATFLVEGVAGVPKYDEALKSARYEYEGSLPPGVITVTLRGGDEGIRSVDGLPYKVVDSWTFTTVE